MSKLRQRRHDPGKLALALRDSVLPLMKELREAVDSAELICPEDVWPLLTPALWKSIPYIFKPYYLTPEQWKLVRTRQTDVPWAAFFEEHPELASSFPCRGKTIIGKP